MNFLNLSIEFYVGHGSAREPSGHASGRAQVRITSPILDWVGRAPNQKSIRLLVARHEPSPTRPMIRYTDTVVL
jgi:hypothetical protein